VVAENVLPKEPTRANDTEGDPQKENADADTRVATVETIPNEGSTRIAPATPSEAASTSAESTGAESSEAASSPENVTSADGGRSGGSSVVLKSLLAVGAGIVLIAAIALLLRPKS
ncbi:MAG: hypothetical protein AAF517_20330, partial [Planctomycetota bacterium]